MKRNILFIKVNALKKPPSILTGVALLLLFTAGFSLNASSQDCSPDTPSFVVDLSDNPEAIWQSEDFFSPWGPCCGMPSTTNCFTFTVNLHEDANAILINFTQLGTGGLLSYSVNCVQFGYVDHTMAVPLCLEGPGPHEITFCRQGTSDYSATISSHFFEHDVTLAPYDGLCADSEMFWFPGDGTYFVDGELSFSFDPQSVEPGDYQITYVYQDPDMQCQGSATQTLTVFPVPELTFPPLEYCYGESQIELTGATPEGGHYSGNYVVDGIFNAAFSGPGSFDITYHYTNDEGCSNHIVSEITIMPPPPANAGEDEIIPQGESTLLQAQGSDPLLYSYHWSPVEYAEDPGSPASATVPLFQSQVYTLTVTDQTGCQNTDNKTVFVSGGDLQILEVSAQPDHICQGDTTYLFVLPSGGSGNYSYHWTANPPLTHAFQPEMQSPAVVPDVTTTFIIEVTDEIYNTKISSQVTVNVDPIPLVELNLGDPTICGNDTYFEFSGGWPDNGYYSIPTLNLYNINSINPSQIAPGIYQVTYTLISGEAGCPGMATDYLTVLPKVKAFFYAQQDFCQTNEVTFFNLSENAHSYDWEIGGLDYMEDVSFDPFLYTFDIPFDYETWPVTLYATSQAGCTHTYTRDVTITAPTIASISTEQETDGCSPHQVSFDNNTTGPASFYLWDFGNGSFSIESQPYHIFENSGTQDTTFTVILTAVAENFMCISRDSIHITVYPNVEAGFGFDAPTSCHPYEIEIFNNAVGADSFEWVFSDGFTSTSDDSVLYHTFRNETDAPTTFQLVQTVTNDYGCFDSMQHELVVYPMQQSGFSASHRTGCSPLTVDFTDESSGAVTSWFYDFGDNATSQSASPQHTFHNTTDSSITYEIIQITDNGYFCPDTSYFSITVHPELQAGFTSIPASGCSPLDVSFTNTSSGHINTWNWNLGNDVTYDTDIDFFFQTYQHDESEPQTYTVSLRVENDHCIDTLTREIVVYPKVEALFEADPDGGCQPLEVTFNNSSTPGITYMWEFGDNSSSGDTNPQHIYQNQNFTDSVTYTASLFVLSEQLCFDYFETDITLQPLVKAQFSIDTVAGCSPFEIAINNESLGAVDFHWSFGDNDFSTLDDPEIYHVYYNTTGEPQTFPLTLTVYNEGGCTDEMIKYITVFPEVTADFEEPPQGCHPLHIAFSNDSENADFYSWQFGQSGSSSLEEPEYTFTNLSHQLPVDYQVVLTARSQHGCVDSVLKTITVDPRPAASFITENSHGCSPNEVIFIDHSQGASHYLWDFGDTNTHYLGGDTITHTYILGPGNQPTTYDVLLEVKNDYGCIDTLSHEVTIFPAVEAALTANTTEDCHPLTVDFTNHSLGADISGYKWFYGDGQQSTNNSETHSHTFNNFSYTETAAYNVTLVAISENHCSDTTHIEIIVNPAPLASFTIPNHTGCGPHEAMLQNLSEGAITYQWDFGDTNTSDTTALEFSHIFTQPADYQQPGQFIVTLTAVSDNGCTQQHQQTVTVFPEITASFSSQESGCHPLEVAFENTSQGATSSLWNLGDNNSSQDYNPEHIYHNYSYDEALDYIVTLTAFNNFECEDIYTDTITVFPVPRSNFDLSTRTGCAVFQPDIYNLSIGGSDFFWDFGNGTSENPEAIFSHSWDNTQEQPVDYLIWLTAENTYGCVDHNAQIINVFPRVTADYTTSDGVFEGCSPFTVQFENLSMLSQYHNWDFGTEQTSGASPLYTFTNNEIDNAIFPVQLISTSVYNCRDTVVKDITVYPSPEVNFMATPIVQTYPSTTISLENLTVAGNWNYEWEFGDGNTLATTTDETFTYTYQWDEEDLSTKTYDVVLKADNTYCQGTKTRQVKITSPVPTANFIPDAKGCSPLHVQFINLSENAHSFMWNFDDGNVAMEENPRHIFFDPGDYNVMLIAYGDGGTDTTYQVVTVFESPVASFYLVNPLIEIPHQPLEVINQSQLADFYLWDFGDGNQSAEFQPQHYYQTPGVYTITLVASTGTTPQCHDTLSLTNGLLVQEACRVVFPNAFTPDATTASGGVYDPNAADNKVFYPLYEGLEEYRLEIYNRWGELLFRSTDPSIGWDGYHRGQLSKMDVYVWRFSGRCENGRKLNMAGDVTLIR